MNIFIKLVTITLLLTNIFCLATSTNAGFPQWMQNTPPGMPSWMQNSPPGSSVLINSINNNHNRLFSNNEPSGSVIMANIQEEPQPNYSTTPSMQNPRPVMPEISKSVKEQDERTWRGFGSGQLDCELSLTVVNGKRVCKGKTLFFDNFKNEQNSKDKWAHEVFIPSYSSAITDTVFNYFDKNGTRFEEGNMVFTPVVMNDNFVRRGQLKLEGCTHTPNEECERTARFQWILPPVASARVTTKNSFSFKYGTIEIKAKFPKGDWLVPELWLVPKNNRYGHGLESGRIIIAMARGNQDLHFEELDLGHRVLESSLLMSSNGTIRSRTLRVKTEEPWHSYNNNYQFTWRPDSYSLSVNGILIGKLVQNNVAETLSSMVGFTHDEQRRWFSGSAMAPFDQEFYIALGLSVGGREFPDNSSSGDYKKPWKSRTVKEMLDFYKARNKWVATWQDEVRKSLRINSVKVSAL